MTSFYAPDELRELGLARYGANVRLSRRAALHNPGSIQLGDDVRIDDFCVLSAGTSGIVVGDNVHVAVFCSLIGAGKISIGSFANLSSRVAIYSSNDDYSGAWMTNPTVPDRYTNVTHADVTVGAHVIIGSGSVVLPGCTLGEGAAIGALSLVRSDCEPFGIYAGVPAIRRGERRRDLLELERQLRRERSSAGERS